MDTRKAGRHLIVLAVLISLCGVVIHIGAIFVGLSWLRFFQCAAKRAVILRSRDLAGASKLSRDCRINGHLCVLRCVSA